MYRNLGVRVVFLVPFRNLLSLKLTQPMKIPIFPGKYYQHAGFQNGYVSLQECISTGDHFIC